MLSQPSVVRHSITQRCKPKLSLARKFGTYQRHLTCSCMCHPGKHGIALHWLLLNSDHDFGPVRRRSKSRPFLCTFYCVGDLMGHVRTFWHFMFWYFYVFYVVLSVLLKTSHSMIYSVCENQTDILLEYIIIYTWSLSIGCQI